MMFNSMLNKLAPFLRWLQTKNFPDGSKIYQTGRDEITYEKNNGQLLEAYVFITGGGYKFDRVIVKDSLRKWKNPDPNVYLSETEQQEIIKKILLYFRREKVGILEHGKEYSVGE